MQDETEIGSSRQMRMLGLLAIISVAFLLPACGGNGQDSEPPPATGTPTLQMNSSEIVTFVQEHQVVKRVEHDDGSWEMTLVPLASRVEEYCSDSPQWSTNEGPTNWRVFAECTKEQSVPVDSPLRFEWLFYPDPPSVQPLNRPAHVAQFQYPWEPEPGEQETPWYRNLLW